MTQELELGPKPEIVQTTVDDIASLRAMQAAAWNDTYPNPYAGVDQEWVEEVTASWLTPEGLEGSREFMGAILDNPRHFHRVAKVDGQVVALVHVSKGEGGHQHLEGLYIDYKYRGTGLAQELMAQAIGWIDSTKLTTLRVAAYNERAIGFYRKYGFVLVEGSEGMFKDKIPDIQMLRRGNESAV